MVTTLWRQCVYRGCENERVPENESEMSKKENKRKWSERLKKSGAQSHVAN
jgi:hypothetical protein